MYANLTFSGAISSARLIGFQFNSGHKMISRELSRALMLFSFLAFHEFTLASIESFRSNLMFSSASCNLSFSLSLLTASDLSTEAGDSLDFSCNLHFSFIASDLSTELACDLYFSLLASDLSSKVGESLGFSFAGVGVEIFDETNGVDVKTGVVCLSNPKSKRSSIGSFLVGLE